MLRELQLQNYNRPIDVFLHSSALGRDLILDPVYQRGSVWTPAQRRMLARSILEGLPIGAIFLNHRSWNEVVCIDGKQRIEAIRAIFNSEVPVPQRWVHDFERPSNPAEAEEIAALMKLEIVYDEWTEKAKRRFGFHGIATYETHFAAPKHLVAELDLFERVNWGGTPQEPEVAERVAALRSAT